MGIGRRIRDIVRSRSQGAGDAESLKDDLDAAYRSHLANLQQVRRGVADVTTSRKRVQIRLSQLTQQAATLDDQARSAVERGDDDAARSALTRKAALDDAVVDLRSRHAALLQEETALTTAAGDLEQTIEDFRLRKDTLSARHSAASARSEVTDARTGITSSLSRVNQQMADAERHTRELEAKAAAVDELVAEGVVGRAGEDADDLEVRRFDRILDAGEDEPDGPHEISS